MFFLQIWNGIAHETSFQHTESYNNKITPQSRNGPDDLVQHKHLQSHRDEAGPLFMCPHRQTGQRVWPGEDTCQGYLSILCPQLLSVLVSLRYNRRSAWSLSAGLVCLSWLGLGLTVHLGQAEGSLFSAQEPLVSEDTSPLGLLDYLPPLLVLVLRVSFQVALAPYPWVYGNELFPLELRSYLCALTASLEPVQQFISCMLFPIIVEV